MLKKMMFAAAALAVSAPAFADSEWRQERRGGYGYRYYHPQPPVYHYAPPPSVYYAPAPVYYHAPPPRVYYAPAPVYRAPLPQNGISIRLHFPL